MGSKGDGKHFVGLRFAWHGLESCCCSSVSESASKGLAPMVSEPASHRGCQTITVFYGFQRWREAFCRAAFCLAWARILLLFGCFGIGLQGACANGFGTSLAPRVPDNNCFLWVPKVTGSILSGCVLLGMGSRGCQTKELFFMGSKGDGKHFVGLRFAWHGLESCCCSSVSEPASKGLLRQWFRNQLESCCCSSVSEPASKGLAPCNGFGTSLAPRAPDNNCFLWVPKVTGSILSGCVLLGMGSNPVAVRVFRNRPPRDLRQWFRNQPRTEGARQKNCFLWVPKVTGSILSGCVLLGMGSNPAAVRAPRNRSPKDLLQGDKRFPMQGHLPRWCRSDEWSYYIGQRDLFFMDSKGDVKQFFGMRFAWHGLESCCCSSVSEPASKGLALRHGLESCCCSGVSEPASKGLAPKRQAFSHARPFAEMMSERRVIWLYLAREIVFYGFQSLKLEQLEVVYQQLGSGIQEFCQTFYVAQGLIRHLSNRRT